MVQKKDLKPLMCVDNRHLNQKIKQDLSAVLNMEESAEHINGCSCFTILDLFSGHWQILISEE